MLALGQRYEAPPATRTEPVTLDPVTLAVLNGRLEQIADEMDATLFRSRLQPDHRRGARRLPRPLPRRDRRHAGAGHVRPADLRRRDGLRGEGRDRQGRARRRPRPRRHLSVQRPLRRRHAPQRLPAGAAADPRRASCSAGSPRSATGSTSAATCPATTTPKATESFQEGVRIPPVKLIARRRACSRTSSTSWPPTRACRSRTGATSTASSTRSISASAACTRCSTNTATRPSRRRFAALRARAEALMRANIAALPDGTYQLRRLPRQ